MATSDQVSDQASTQGALFQVYGGRKWRPTCSVHLLLRENDAEHPFLSLHLGVTEFLIVTAYLKEVLGAGIYLRYGTKGIGMWSVRINHIVHLTGAATGIAAFFVQRALRIRGWDGDAGEEFSRADFQVRTATDPQR